ncbi:MAG: 5'/3'-nucleotidase SurE [Fimbriimonadaceae bacterium]|nr:5'/3'-nucleotidase SurE [Fimbriimonadaceae bacterium]
MRILVTNDDGAGAEGILVLAHAASVLGEVKVAAPDRERSACGHAMTLRDPLRVDPYPLEGFECITVNGYPVDCINVGLALLWPDGCDLVLSGINPGPNMGFDATYSGTVAGAMEGAINGIRSVAISMCPFAIGAPFHFETGRKWLEANWNWLLSLPNGQRTFYNVNLPAIEFEEVEGSLLTEMGRRVYEERVERREDPWGRPYFWQGGTLVAYNDVEGTDIMAVKDKFASVTPMSLDWTDKSALARAREVSAPSL